MSKFHRVAAAVLLVFLAGCEDGVDKPKLTISIPSTITASEMAIVEDAGVVRVAFAPMTDLVVSLKTEGAKKEWLVLPGYVTVTAGVTFATFDLGVVSYPPQDSAVQEQAVVTVTASSPGYENGSAQITVVQVALEIEDAVTD